MKWTAIFILAFIAPASAEEALDCKNPVSQQDMTLCAAGDFATADKALNKVWPKYKSSAEASDKDTGKHEYMNALKASQRTWLAYLEAQCTWQGFDMHGGSGEPMLYYGCKARLTKERIKELAMGTE